MPEPKGIALTIGLDFIDQDFYGTDGKLGGCVNDAREVAKVASALGYDVRTSLTNERATTSAFKLAVESIARELTAGDIFLLHYSGHGTQVPDKAGSVEEGDDLDEALCLFDRTLLDDELRQLWTKFAQGVRVVFIADCCHSGTISKGDLEETVRDIDSGGLVPRELPVEDREALYARNAKFLDKLQADVNRDMPDDSDLKATIILLAGCHDDETAKDDGTHGIFTRALLGCHQQGKLTKDKYSYKELIAEISAQIPAKLKQHPRITTLDLAELPLSALIQKPFAIK